MGISCGMVRDTNVRSCRSRPPRCNDQGDTVELPDDNDDKGLPKWRPRVWMALVAALVVLEVPADNFAMRENNIRVVIILRLAHLLLLLRRCCCRWWCATTVRLLFPESDRGFPEMARVTTEPLRYDRPEISPKKAVARISSLRWCSNWWKVKTWNFQFCSKYQKYKELVLQYNNIVRGTGTGNCLRQ